MITQKTVVRVETTTINGKQVHARTTVGIDGGPEEEVNGSEAEAMVAELREVLRRGFSLADRFREILRRVKGGGS